MNKQELKRLENKVKLYMVLHGHRDLTPSASVFCKVCKWTGSKACNIHISIKFVKGHLTEDLTVGKDTDCAEWVNNI